jgi:hypothetical protein
LEEKDKKEKDTKEVVTQKTTQEDTKQLSISKEDETSPIRNWIRKQKVSSRSYKQG